MDDQIRAEYELLYESAFPKESLYATFVPSPGLAPPSTLAEKRSISDRFFEDSKVIRQILGEAEQRLGHNGRSLRPDAKFFLLTNFLQMVAMPLRFTRRLGRDEFGDLLSADINILLEQAAKERPLTREISAHAVIDALSRYWKLLNLSRFRLWED
jgi:hypothetical protein